MPFPIWLLIMKMDFLVEADNVDQAVEAVYKLYNDNILREKSDKKMDQCV